MYSAYFLLPTSYCLPLIHGKHLYQARLQMYSSQLSALEREKAVLVRTVYQDEARAQPFTGGQGTTVYQDEAARSNTMATPAAGAAVRVE